MKTLQRKMGEKPQEERELSNPSSETTSDSPVSQVKAEVRLSFTNG